MFVPRHFVDIKKELLIITMGFFIPIMKPEHKCWHFIMSSFARSYGVEYVKSHVKFHEIALQWCDDHDYTCDVHLDSLSKVDAHFKKIYEEWDEVLKK